jgi:hypothetical protein
MKHGDGREDNNDIFQKLNDVLSVPKNKSLINNFRISIANNKLELFNNNGSKIAIIDQTNPKKIRITKSKATNQEIEETRRIIARNNPTNLEDIEVFLNRLSNYSQNQTMEFNETDINQSINKKNFYKNN